MGNDKLIENGIVLASASSSKTSCLLKYLEACVFPLPYSPQLSIKLELGMLIERLIRFSIFSLIFGNPAHIISFESIDGVNLKGLDFNFNCSIFICYLLFFLYISVFILFLILINIFRKVQLSKQILNIF